MWTSKRKLMLGGCIVLALVALVSYGVHENRQRSNTEKLLGILEGGPSAGPRFVNSGAIDNEAVRKVINAVSLQSSYSARFTFQNAGVTEEWDVSYIHMNDVGGQWKASGQVRVLQTGKHIVFDSLNTSTCLQQLQPEKGPWVYHEHISWVNSENPGALTPPIPMSPLRLEPQPEWTIVDDLELIVVSESVLSEGDPAVPSGLKGKVIKFALSIHPDTWLPDVAETQIGNEVVSTVEYERYGQADVSGVHTSKSDCKARNG